MADAIRRLALLAVLVSVPAGAEPADELAQRASELAALRSEVNLLDTQLRSERDRGLAEQQALERRRSEARLELDGLQRQQRATREQLTALEEKLRARSGRSMALEPVLLEQLARGEAQVAASLPFRREERVATLRALADELRAARSTPEAVAVKLWRFTEDELRMTAEVERAEIPLALEEGGPVRLVEVVRLGMVSLFTRLAGESYGQLARGADGSWRHAPIEQEPLRREVAALFEALDRHERDGYYRLPLPRGER